MHILNSSPIRGSHILCAVLIIASACVVDSAWVDDKDPIVLIPGFVSSQLHAHLKRSHVPHTWCKKKSDDYMLWVRATMMANPVQNVCWADNARLLYDPVKNELTSQEGVDVFIQDYGRSTSIQCVDPSLCKQTVVWKDFVESFKAKGYVEGKNMFAAPYDWRAGWCNEDVFDGQSNVRADGRLKCNSMAIANWAKLKALIEEIYNTTGGRRVHLIGHSMGAPYANAFLQHYVRQTWKDQYISSFITMGGVFGGSAQVLEVILSSSDYDIPFIPLPFYIHIRDAMRTILSTIQIVPQCVPSWKNFVLVHTPSYNYTACDMGKLFARMGGLNSNVTVELFESEQRNGESMNVLSAPGVRMFVLYSDQLTTISGYHYKVDNDFNVKPHAFDYEAGDNTVIRRSLVWPMLDDWQQKQPNYPIVFKNFYDIVHRTFPSSPSVQDYIYNITTGLM